MDHYSCSTGESVPNEALGAAKPAVRDWKNVLCSC